MFRRATAISLLFLANIVLLAVTVVPHHHHGDMICFIASHCGGNDHSESDCSHDAEQPLHSSGANCCNIEEWLLSNIGSGHKHQCHCVCTTCSSDLFITLLPDLSEPTIQPVVCLTFRQAPTNETYLCIYVSQILGLRAPPVC